MNDKRIRGINGVLDGLISASDATKQKDETTSEPQRRQGGTQARQGRPFSGGKKRPHAKKEKMTVRVAPDLAETYRQWSWNARCSLSELIETAMREYHARRNSR